MKTEKLHLTCFSCRRTLLRAIIRHFYHQMHFRNVHHHTKIWTWHVWRGKVSQALALIVTHNFSCAFCCVCQRQRERFMMTQFLMNSPFRSKSFLIPTLTPPSSPISQLELEIHSYTALMVVYVRVFLPPWASLGRVYETLHVFFLLFADWIRRKQ